MANKLTRLGPFQDLARFEPLRSLEDFFTDFQWRPAIRGMEAEPRIKVDVTESNGNYNIKAEIPGVKKEDIKVNVEGSRITISAETRQEKEEKSDERVVRQERYYGQQMRSFSLDCEVDESKSSARYHNGVLELVLPKKVGAEHGKLLTIE